MNKILKIILLLVTIFAFCFFAYQITTYLVEERKSKELNEELIEIAITYNSQEENKENKLPISVNFEKLKTENKDIIAWIFAENTPINYPIVQANDNNYYLRRLINGNYNQAGTIFLDYRNNLDLSDFNNIIYGHNMKNGSMFGTLSNYKDQSYYEDHKQMYIFTQDRNYVIELFAGLTLNDESEIYNLTNERNIKFIHELKRKSTFKSDVEINDNDIFITLSTCAYDYDGARYVVLGILKEVNMEMR